MALARPLSQRGAALRARAIIGACAIANLVHGPNLGVGALAGMVPVVAAAVSTPRRAVVSGARAQESVHSFEVPGPDGEPVAMAAFKANRVLLLTNVASQCGLTDSNYRGLQELQARFGGRSFSVVAFPANDFAGQEPGTNDDIQAFAASKGVTFPVLGKISVRGEAKHPLWAWLEVQPSEGFGLSSILKGPQWNFHKVLVVDGKVVQHYAPTTSPESIADDIERALTGLKEPGSE